MREIIDSEKKILKRYRDYFLELKNSEIFPEHLKSEKEDFDYFIDVVLMQLIEVTEKSFSSNTSFNVSNILLSLLRSVTDGPDSVIDLDVVIQKYLLEKEWKKITSNPFSFNNIKDLLNNKSIQSEEKSELNLFDENGNRLSLEDLDK